MDVNCLFPWTKQLLSHPKPYCELGAVDSRWVRLYVHVAISALLTMSTWLKHSASPLIFACWGPQGKLYLFGRIYIFYPWGGHYFHFPRETEPAHFPVYFLQFQADTLAWVVWHRRYMAGQVRQAKGLRKVLVNVSLWCCWEMLEADTDGWKDADGALSVLFCFLLDHCQCPLCKK